MTAIISRLRHRLAAGRVVGHLNVRRCSGCRGWHHRDYHRTSENGRSTPCENYTARSWSPGSERPEDARCVNCNQSHGPAVGGSESRVAPGQLADEERSAPPTDLGLGNGSTEPENPHGT